MLNITLLDGKKLQFPGKVNGHEIAKTISPSLAKKALVIKVNDSFKDLSSFIEKDSTVQIITIEDDYGLEVIRHDTAHVLAMAVQELFKDTQVTIGPVIENGFYYDFSRKKPFTDEDLVKIEEKMKEIIDRDEPTTREVWDREKAIEHFKKKRRTL
jgi:threonyl-tRNA synthetase